MCLSSRSGCCDLFAPSSPRSRLIHSSGISVCMTFCDDEMKNANVDVQSLLGVDSPGAFAECLRRQSLFNSLTMMGNPGLAHLLLLDCKTEYSKSATQLCRSRWWSRLMRTLYPTLLSLAWTLAQNLLSHKGGQGRKKVIRVCARIGQGRSSIEYSRAARQCDPRIGLSARACARGRPLRKRRQGQER